MDNSDSLAHLFEIFSPTVNSIEDIIIDGVKNWALIEESVSLFRRYYYIDTFMSVNAVLKQAKESYKSNDWRPIYIVQLSDGRGFEVDIIASIGEEISIEG